LNIDTQDINSVDFGVSLFSDVLGNQSNIEGNLSFDHSNLQLDTSVPETQSDKVFTRQVTINNINERGAQYKILKIYVRDAHIEIPYAPQIFSNQDQATNTVEIFSDAQEIETDIIEVRIVCKLTSQISKQMNYYIEIEQAGLFEIKNYSQIEQEQMLTNKFPKDLFPALRINIADLLARSGLPPFYLQDFYS
jgi:preprotein translocase subunit SecB